MNQSSAYLIQIITKRYTSLYVNSSQEDIKKKKRLHKSTMEAYSNTETMDVFMWWVKNEALNKFSALKKD